MKENLYFYGLVLWTSILLVYKLCIAGLNTGQNQLLNVCKTVTETME